MLSGDWSSVPKLPDLSASPSLERSRNMAAIRRADTAPELKLRGAIHRRGLRFRKDYAIRLEGRLVRPDIAFTKARLAVFLDGCFWHGCPEHGRPPKSNRDYWVPKLNRNAERDVEQTALLERGGWSVVRIWEHTRLEEAVSRVSEALKALQVDGANQQATVEIR